MSSQPQSAPAFKPCPECGGRRIAVEDHMTSSHGASYIYLTPIRRTPSSWTLWKSRKSETLTLTCLQCGYTAWYALEPLNLLPDEQ
ncbi:hypothetical protein KSF_080100 [Reticulibacter mediterranei]|uniref:Uncharacterized protein n=1 Tax=Reticulibacter mediterranei TaxID=2778369 RepID=A0A8J3IW78_9CHLR|nr:hypothetical protein [Reticulibacter mediterranei]GHO97962.1 hypothetical protein KSF_080100 [Reticulibacter mediterranei]